jgi:DNA (cytosine-5)-methyltransferase 1
VSLTVGSLFSGIGGIDLGLERAGMKVVWQVEKDPYARQVLKKHWPHAKLCTDVRDAHPRGWCTNGLYYKACCLEPVDLVCGGFPCQDISNAGKRGGITAPRSGLWKEFARIVGELRPRYVLIENVPALRTRGLRAVLSDLHACGYDAEWDGVSAAALGAPQLRDRLFVVAYAQQLQLRQQSGRGSGTNGQGSVLASEPGAEGSATNADSTGELQPSRRVFQVGQRPSDGGWWGTEPDVERVVYGVPAGVDRIRCLGNAVVPQVAEYVGRLIVDFDACRAGLR